MVLDYSCRLGAIQADGVESNGPPMAMKTGEPAMTSRIPLRWAVLVSANVLGWCMLCLLQPTLAAPAKEPFANAVEQRFEIISQLKEINAQLKEQNALLRSGTLRVVADPPRK
jgi:hypothetical protein